MRMLSFIPKSKERSDKGPKMSAESGGIQKSETAWWCAVAGIPRTCARFSQPLVEMLERASARFDQAGAMEFGLLSVS